MIIRLAKKGDEKYIREIMVSFRLPKKIFITSSLERIEKLIGEGNSMVCEDEKGICGFVLVENKNYIDTICSKRESCGSLLLSSLPEGRYEVNISKENKKSQKLFGKMGFTYMYDEEIEGQNRGRYEGYIK